MDVSPTVKPIEVRSTDVDADGIVNNAIFYQYCEQARLEHLLRIGFIKAGADRGPRARRFTIAENRCRYVAPAYFRDVVDVEVTTTHVGRSSFSLGYRVLHHDAQTLLAESESVQVWLGAEGRPEPLPDDVRGCLEASRPAPA